MEGLAGLAQAAAQCLWRRGRIFGCAEEDRFAGVGDFFLLWIARNPLKSPESDEGIQENPRESKPAFLGFSWSGLDSAWGDLA